MKSKEELDALKEEVEAVNEKLHELTEEELEKVTGGASESNKKERGSIAMAYGYLYVAGVPD